MDDKKIKVLHLYTDLNLTSGITRSIYFISKYSSKLFVHYTIALNGDGIAYFKENGLNVHGLSTKKRNIFTLIRALFFLFKYCHVNNINIINSHHRFFDLIASILKRFYKVKTVTSVHSIVSRKKYLSYKADILIAAGEKVKDHLIKYFNKDPNRIRIINNFIIPLEVKINEDRKQLRERLDFNDGDFVILFIGRFSREKGVDILLKAFSSLKENKDMKLLMIGEGEEEEMIKSFIEKEGKKMKIISPQKLVYDWYNIADLVVLPSRVDPFPFVMLEAGLMKKAFIGCKVGGISEVIINKENGLLVSPGNEDQLATAIMKIYKNKKLAEALAENLQRKIFECYTGEKILPQYEKLYQELFT